MTKLETIIIIGAIMIIIPITTFFYLSFQAGDANVFMANITDPGSLPWTIGFGLTAGLGCILIMIGMAMDSKPKGGG